MTEVRKLTNLQLAQFALAALDNARSLYDSATLLHGHGRLAPAYTLAGLAADELGKHILVCSFPSRPQSDDEWRKLWRRLGRHTEKLGDMLVSGWMGRTNDFGPVPDAEDVHRRRLNATYVDVNGDGGVRRPADGLSRADVARFLSHVADELDYCERTNGGASAEQLAATFDKLPNSPITKLIDELTQIHPLGGVAFAATVRNGTPPEQIRDRAIEMARLMALAEERLDQPAGVETMGIEPTT